MAGYFSEKSGSASAMKLAIDAARLGRYDAPTRVSLSVNVEDCLADTNPTLHRDPPRRSSLVDTDVQRDKAACTIPVVECSQGPFECSVYSSDSN